MESKTPVVAPCLKALSVGNPNIVILAIAGIQKKKITQCEKLLRYCRFSQKVRYLENKAYG